MSWLCKGRTSQAQGRQRGEAGGQSAEFAPGARHRVRNPQSPGDEERIFEPFVTERTRGTGLGLPVARRAVLQHGGTLRGETHPDGGACFSLVLPGAAREM